MNAGKLLVLVWCWSTNVEFSLLDLEERLTLLDIEGRLVTRSSWCWSNTEQQRLIFCNTVSTRFWTTTDSLGVKNDCPSSTLKGDVYISNTSCSRFFSQFLLSNRIILHVFLAYLTSWANFPRFTLTGVIPSREKGIRRGHGRFARNISLRLVREERCAAFLLERILLHVFHQRFHPRISSAGLTSHVLRWLVSFQVVRRVSDGSYGLFARNISLRLVREKCYAAFLKLIFSS